LFAFALLLANACLTFRTPNHNWKTKLQAKGQQINPQFARVKSSTGRTINTIRIVTDTIQKPWALFVHGSPGSADAALNYLADTFLSNHFNLLTYDRAGFGYTAFGCPEVSFEKQAADIKAIQDSLVKSNSLLLIGHSLGGPIIFKFAMDYPGNLAGIVCVAGSVDPSLEPTPWWQSVVDNPLAKCLIPKTLWASNHEIRQAKKELTKMIADWVKITAPVEIIHAKNDRLVPVGNASYELGKLTNAKANACILEKGDHFIMWTAQEKIVKTMVQLIKSGNASNR